MFAYWNCGNCLEINSHVYIREEKRVNHNYKQSKGFKISSQPLRVSTLI